MMIIMTKFMIMLPKQIKYVFDEIDNEDESSSTDPLEVVQVLLQRLSRLRVRRLVCDVWIFLGNWDEV